MSNRNTYLHEVSRYLKANLPLEHPVYVRMVKMPKGDDGDCNFYKNRKKSDRKFVIRIHNELSTLMAVEVLIHEMAHVLAWGKDKDFHGPNWGKAYSIVYRCFLDFLGW